MIKTNSLLHLKLLLTLCGICVVTTYISYFLSFYYTTIRTQYLPSKHLEVDQKGLGSSDANGSPPLIHFHRLILLLPLHMTRLIVKRLSTERRDLPQLHLRRRVFRRQPLRLCFLHPIG